MFLGVGQTVFVEADGVNVFHRCRPRQVVLLPLDCFFEICVAARCYAFSFYFLPRVPGMKSDPPWAQDVISFPFLGSPNRISSSSSPPPSYHRRPIAARPATTRPLSHQSTASRAGRSPPRSSSPRRSSRWSCSTSARPSPSAASAPAARWGCVTIRFSNSKQSCKFTKV